jgi:hypothetical protein
VIGDPQDPKAKFAQQAEFVEGLQAGGSEATLIKVAARKHHGATDYALAAAGGCMAGMDDSKIIKAMNGLTKRTLQREASAKISQVDR